jgi:hypothetical protein
MRQRNGQEIGNAKPKDDQCGFGRVRWGGNGDIDGGRAGHGRVAANNGDP